MNDQLILKNRLKEIRAEKGLSQAELAEMVGVSRNTISSIETGQFSPTAKLAMILCVALEGTEAANRVDPLYRKKADGSWLYTEEQANGKRADEMAKADRFRRLGGEGVARE